LVVGVELVERQLLAAQLAPREALRAQVHLR
jgi:hypothetical protein